MQFLYFWEISRILGIFKDSTHSDIISLFKNYWFMCKNVLFKKENLMKLEYSTVEYSQEFIGRKKCWRPQYCTVFFSWHFYINLSIFHKIFTNTFIVSVEISFLFKIFTFNLHLLPKKSKGGATVGLALSVTLLKSTILWVMWNWSF